MKYSINLFGYNLDCVLAVQDGNIQIAIPSNEQNSLKAYLSRVLERYTELSSSDTESIEVLVQKAIEVEKQMNGRMSEPRIKLPYEFLPETKEKLIEAASLQDLSATQLLIRMVEDKYQEVFHPKK